MRLRSDNVCAQQRLQGRRSGTDEGWPRLQHSTETKDEELREHRCWMLTAAGCAAACLQVRTL
jgi:hypothetical protein